jgi:hypothetical protein
LVAVSNQVPRTTFSYIVNNGHRNFWNNFSIDAQKIDAGCRDFARVAWHGLLILDFLILDKLVLLLFLLENIWDAWVPRDNLFVHLPLKALGNLLFEPLPLQLHGAEVSLLGYLLALLLKQIELQLQLALLVHVLALVPVQPLHLLLAKKLYHLLRVIKHELLGASIDFVLGVKIAHREFTIVLQRI